MKRILLFVIISITMSSCGNNPQQSQPRPDSADPHIDAVVTDSQNTDKEITDDDRYAYVNDTFVTIPAGGKLRYLFYANGGLWGYYNDGTVSDCPRCDFYAGAIAFLNKRNPYATYTADEDSLTITYNDGTKEKVELYEESEDAPQGWALIDYKWLKKARAIHTGE